MPELPAAEHVADVVETVGTEGLLFTVTDVLSETVLEQPELVT